MPVYWNYAVERKFTDYAPQRAHALAAAGAAGNAAKLINSTYTGTLARAVSVPAPVGPLTSEIGSGAGGQAPLPYGRIEHFGGTIMGRPLLYIRDRRGGTARSTTGGTIVAVASQVYHKPKYYLNGALDTYVPLFLAACMRFMPK